MCVVAEGTDRLGQRPARHHVRLQHQNQLHDALWLDVSFVCLPHSAVLSTLDFSFCVAFRESQIKHEVKNRDNWSEGWTGLGIIEVGICFSYGLQMYRCKGLQDSISTVICFHPDRMETLILFICCCSHSNSVDKCCCLFQLICRESFWLSAVPFDIVVTHITLYLERIVEFVGIKE